jgi:hypothetical protein
MPRQQPHPLSPPGCLRIRLRIPPSLSRRNFGACRSPGPRNTRLVARISNSCRCIGAHAASPARRSACEIPSDRSLRGESRRSDGTATTLRSSRADLAVFRACHALGTSSRRWSCGGRSYPSHSTSRSPPTWRERGAWREQVAPIRPQAGVGRVLVWACFGRRKLSPLLAYCGWYTRVRVLAHDSKHRAASAGLLATAGEAASGMSIVTCIRDGRVPQAAAGLRLEHRLSWQVPALTW